MDKTVSSQIKKTPDVCGGAACVRDTRIPVWTLVRLRQLGRNDRQLLMDFAGLTPGDLIAAWDYYDRNIQEIENAIAIEEDDP